MRVEQTPSGKIVRYEYTDPADLAEMIAKGIIWSGPAEGKQAAIEALVNGLVPMPDNLPPEIRSYIEQLQASQGAPS